MIALKVNKTFWIFIVILFVLVFSQVWLRQTIILQCIFLILGILISSFIWGSLSTYGITLTRTSLSRREKLGQIIEERYEIINQSRLPKLWIEVVDESQLPGKNAHKTLTSINPNQARIFQHLRRLSKRGEFELGPTKIESGDPLGLFSKSIYFFANKRILVLPFSFTIESVKSTQGTLTGKRAIRKTAKDTTVYASSVREHSPGDPLNRIHWRSTAKKDRLMVKEFEEEPHSNVWIFLDADKRFVYSLENQAKDDEEIAYSKNIFIEKYILPEDSFEYAIAICSSLVEYFIRTNRAVGLASSPGKIITHTPEKGERQLSKIIDTLAFIKPEGELPFGAFILSQMAFLTRGAAVYLITSNYASEIIVTVDQLNRRGNKVVLIIVDGGSFGGKQKAKHLQEQIDSRGISIVIVKSQDDIGIVLQETLGVEETRKLQIQNT